MTTYPDHILRMGSQHLAELKRKAAEFERQLWDAHESLDYEMTQSSYAPQDDTQTRQEAFRWSQDDYEPDDGALPAGPVSARPPVGAGLVDGSRDRDPSIPDRQSGEVRGIEGGARLDRPVHRPVRRSVGLPVRSPRHPGRRPSGTGRICRS